MEDNDWALTGAKDRKRRIVNSLFLDPAALNAHNIKLKEKYDRVYDNERRWELYADEEGYDLLVVAFGTMARVCKTAIDETREEGHRVALFRPITINPYPFPECRQAMDAIRGAGRVLTIELNMGQMIHDVKYAAEGTREVEFYGTAGGIVPSPDQVADRIRRMLRPETENTTAVEQIEGV